MARSLLSNSNSTLPSLTVLINSNSKWGKELRDISNQGWRTKMVDNFGQDLDVMIQCKPKQIVCVISGADLLFEWKRKQQIARIRNVATFFKHSYVVVIIKHDLEIRKADEIFSKLLDINIETLYVSDLNECVRFFGFVAKNVTKWSASRVQNQSGVDSNCNGEDDENTHPLDTALNLYLGDTQRIIDIVCKIADVDVDDAYLTLSNFKSIKGLSNASIQQMTDTLPFDNDQIETIYNTFTAKQEHSERRNE